MDWREEQQQSIGQGYQHQGNSATLQQDTIDAIACLAEATASDRNTVENLTETNSVLTAELTARNNKLVTALMKITKLTDQIASLKNGKVPSDGTPKLYYCHSCGYGCPHHSGNCDKQKEGHVKWATNDNKLGGTVTKYKK